MKKMRLFVGFVAAAVFLVALTACASAISNKEIADANYGEATKLFTAGSCENASDSANRALNLYTTENDADGVSKTMDLIGKIGDCIKKNADAKYDQAYKSYVAKKYTDTVLWAQRAKEEYSLLVGFDGENGVAKCDNLITDTLLEIKKQKIKDADTKYQKAYSLYEQQDFGNAKKLGADAFKLYNETDYEQGIELCNALFEEIDNKVIELQNIADESLRTAREEYKSAYDNANFEQYIDASNKAMQARDLYSKINFIQGYKDAQEVITNSNNEIGRMEETSKQAAAKYFQDGQNEELLGRGTRMENEAEKVKHFDNAIKSFNLADAIYLKLKDWAHNLGRGDKEDAYKALVADCATRLAEIATEKGNIATRKKADDLYTAAQGLFTKGECRNASKFANDGRSLFQKISDQPDVFKSDTLLYQINVCIAKLKAAEANLANYSRYYKVADYTNASLELDKALKAYTDIKYQTGIDNCNKQKTKISESVGKKKSADDLMKQAQNDFTNRRYEESIKGATSAKAGYQAINFLEGIKKADTLIKQNQDRQILDKKEGEKNIEITIGAIVAAIVLVMIVWGARKVQKQKSDKEKLDTEKRKFAEEVRRKHEEDRLGDAARLKELEMEREKLKAMIDAEMKKAERDRRELHQ